MLSALDRPALAVSDLVLALFSAVEPVAGDAATGLAIVAVTVAVRLLLLPLGRRAARAGRARAALRPAQQRLQQRLRHDPVRLRRELAALHRAHGTSPFAGITPLLAQLPFFMVLYRLFSSPTLNGHANALFTHTVLGVPLSDRWAAAVTSGVAPPELLVFGTVLVLLIVVAWWSSRQARQALAATPGTDAAAGSPEAVAAQLARFARIAPYGTVVVAAFLPLAAALYLLTTTAWTAAERWAFGTYRAPAAA